MWSLSQEIFIFVSLGGFFYCFLAKKYAVVFSQLHLHSFYHDIITVYILHLCSISEFKGVCMIFLSTSF